jgi:hypothetical protein
MTMRQVPRDPTSLAAVPINCNVPCFSSNQLPRQSTSPLKVVPFGLSPHPQDSPNRSIGPVGPASHRCSTRSARPRSWHRRPRPVGQPPGLTPRQPPLALSFPWHGKPRKQAGGQCQQRLTSSIGGWGNADRAFFGTTTRGHKSDACAREVRPCRFDLSVCVT